MESPKKKVKNKRNGFRIRKRDKTGIEESFNDLFNQFKEIEGEYSFYGNEESNLKVRDDGEKIDDKEFLMEDYASEDEKSGLSKRKSGGICLSSSEGEEEEGDENSDEEEEADFKIYFCSRTHSQLSQFVKELKKTVFANEIKIASLASRKNFCINEGKLLLL